MQHKLVTCLIISVGATWRVFDTCFLSYSGSAELVFVSHVINPCHFYIRRYSQMKEAGVLEKKLKKLCCSKSSYLLSSDVLELGKLLISEGHISLKCYLAVCLP